MLSKNEIDRIKRGSCIYDHAWQLFSNFLGEPFLIDDHLVYFDGKMLFVNCYRLFNPNVDSDCEQLAATLLNRREFRQTLAIEFWGRFSEPSSHLTVEGRTFERVEFSDYNETGFESLVNVGEQ